ncbi:MAG: peptide chain release factor H, partial [Bacteroidota bacterium]
MHKYMIQISSGRGPEECARVVAKVLEVLLKEARAQDLQVEVVETVPGNLNGTLLSALLQLKGTNAEAFTQLWQGTVQWIAQSPYRKYHKRKNWFVGVQVFDITKDFQWEPKQVSYESMRASGPGGQHVNKTESAIRAKHLPSGITVVASERRSQLQNKAEATERLKAKVQQWSMQEAANQLQDQWEQHTALIRGNPVRTFQERL